MTRTADAHNAELRVLVCAPAGRDAQLTCAVLREHGLAAEVCASLAELCREIAWGAGAAFITKEAVTNDSARLLTTTLAAQPAWSDLPLVILTANGATAAADTRATLTALSDLGNVTLIERPVRAVTLVSVLKSALRARLRQYEVRDQLQVLAAAQAEREQMLKREQGARQLAETNNRLKDEFLATISHELRTPLTAILGWIQFLRRGQLDKSAADHALDVIDRNGQAQLHLIEDLLDVSRIITGKLQLDVRALDLAAVVIAALDAARPAATAKEIELLARFDPAAARVSGDADRLQQVVWNLVNNAVKFTPQGGRVEISTHRVGAHVEIRVADTGTGIAPEFLPYVFDRFRQADGQMTRTHGGLGPRPRYRAATRRTARRHGRGRQRRRRARRNLHGQPAAQRIADCGFRLAE